MIQFKLFSQTHNLIHKTDWIFFRPTHPTKYGKFNTYLEGFPKIYISWYFINTICKLFCTYFCVSPYWCYKSINCSARLSDFLSVFKLLKYFMAIFDHINIFLWCVFCAITGNCSHICWSCFMWRAKLRYDLMLNVQN